ncbi:MAG TPA: pyridoxamine 5'-phosphate oxidase family protein [Acidimicrobiales bacterium]|nr:pyridoxamine 5'-phosphate oxidase family protein [Acidimicrobiales bacterium]
MVSSDVGDLGRRVSERRRVLGLSVEALAERAGMDPSYLRTLETSPSPQLSRAALWRLAAALETTMDLVTGGGMQAPPGRDQPSGNPVLDALDPGDCRDLIRPGGVGRIVFCESRGPVALPVNFRVLDGDVVFRTAALPELTSTEGLGTVSFEVDHIDEALAEGWSVLVSGVGHVITDASELRQAEATGVAPWAGGERDLYIRIVPREVTGRRIRCR